MGGKNKWKRFFCCSKRYSLLLRKIVLEYTLSRACFYHRNINKTGSKDLPPTIDSWNSAPQKPYDFSLALFSLYRMEFLTQKLVKQQQGPISIYRFSIKNHIVFETKRCLNHNSIFKIQNFKNLKFKKVAPLQGLKMLQFLRW